jgi:hypothetical protein
MGRAGREMFLREFNWDAEKKRLLDLYDGLCPSREPVAQAAAVAQAK